MVALTTLAASFFVPAAALHNPNPEYVSDVTNSGSGSGDLTIEVELQGECGQMYVEVIETGSYKLGSCGEPLTFEDQDISEGGTFEVCASVDEDSEQDCEKGVNGAEQGPERITNCNYCLDISPFLLSNQDLLKILVLQ